MSDPKFETENISPELAAEVVHSYLLPLFDSDKMRSDKKQSFKDNTVLSELLLSEKLMFELK